MGVVFPGETPAYRVARDRLLDAETELRRSMESVAEARRRLPPGGPVPEDYVFRGRDHDGGTGPVRLSELFGTGQSSLAIYSFMFPRSASDARPGPALGATARLPLAESPCPSCTALLDQLDGAVPHLSQRMAFAVVAPTSPDRLGVFAAERGWRHLRLLSTDGNGYNRAYHGETGDGAPQPMLNVFGRGEDGTVRHIWGSELLHAPADPGQDPRHLGTLEPLWNMFDLIPEGRGQGWDEQLDYACCGAPAEAAGDLPPRRIAGRGHDMTDTRGVLARTEIVAFADRLDEAERTRRQTRALSILHPGATIADAYAVQDAWVAAKLGAGRAVIGHKIGLTSKAMQAAVGIGEPDSGYLLDDMLFPDGGTVPGGRFIALRVEAELAFVLKSDLAGPDRTLFDVLNATDYVTPALEILDTRVFRSDPETKAPRQVVDTIADNAANAGIVLGGRPFRPGDHDLRWIGAICSKNAAVEETGLAAGVLNHPASGVAWLTRRLAGQGRGLKAGEIVLAGSFIRPIEVGPGDTIVADYGPFGTVSCHFAREGP